MSNAALSTILGDLEHKAGGRTVRDLDPCRLTVMDVEIHTDNGVETFQLVDDPEKRQAEREAAKMVLDLIREHRPEWLAA